MKKFFKEKEQYIYGLVLFAFISVVLLTCGESFFKEYSPEEKEEIKQEILSEIDADELCQGIFSEVYGRIDFVEGESFEEDFAEVNEYQKNFFIAQEFNEAMEEGGIGLYLYYSGCTFTSDLADVLNEFGLKDFSELWTDFMENPDMDWIALRKEICQYDSWAVTESELLLSLYDKYPLKTFDEAFFSLNKDDIITRELNKYAREHIDQYDYGRISERHLFR